MEVSVRRVSAVHFNALTFWSRKKTFGVFFQRLIAVILSSLQCGVHYFSLCFSFLGLHG